MQDKIKSAIAAYLERETSHCNGFGRGEWIEFGGSLNPAGVDHAGFCEEIAAELYSAAIAPHLGTGEPDWSNAPEWAEWLSLSSIGACYFEKCPDFLSKANCFLVSAGKWEVRDSIKYSHIALFSRPQ